MNRVRARNAFAEVLGTSEMVGRVTPCAPPSELLMKRRAEDYPPYPPQPMRLPYNSESRTISA